MNVIITGSTGLLGYNLQQHCPSGISIKSVYHPNEQPLSHKLPYPSQPLDITNHLNIKSLFNNFSPDIVIHTAAQGSLDWCEDNQKEASEINVTSAKNIIALCSKNNTRFIFISSNAVYDGTHQNNSEETKPNPINHYGKMKVAIEEHLKQQNLSYTILRPNLMYGWPYPDGRDNQVTRVISSLRSNKPINVVSDTYFSPLSVSFMSKVVWQVVINKINGTYNIGGANRMNLFKLSQITAETFNLNSSLISPISYKNTSASAKRAIDTSFDTTLMQHRFKIPPLSVIDGLNEMKVYSPHAILAQ